MSLPWSLSLSVRTMIAQLSHAGNRLSTGTFNDKPLKISGGALRKCSWRSATWREKIAGYYSLSAASFEKDELPSALAKRLPHYPVPAAVLGRLAIDRDQQGRGLGETLLLDAIRRVVRASTTIAVYATIVDAKNERAQAFYERYGFRAFASEPRRLFLPLETFEKLGL